MRLKINIPVFAVVGAAALFVGLAGDVGAIPDSMRDNLDTGMRSWVSSNDNSDYDAVRSIGRDPAGSSSSVFFGADLKQNMGMSHNLGSRVFNYDNDGVTTIPTWNGHGRSSASVPDGGTTVMMLGGALCGIVLLAKKLKV
jgi:hypothetical protein